MTACCAYDYKAHLGPVAEYKLSDDEQQLIDAIYNKDGVKYDRATYLKNIDTLKAGLVKGGLGPDQQYGNEDYLAATMMEVNLNRFGFNKNLAQVYQLNQALKQTGTYNDFKAAATQILGTYNKAYLETEYNTAIAVGQNAANWIRQKSQQNAFPYLMYQTAGDSHVRPAHAELNGLVFAVNDKTMGAVYPPNGYNCRCEMVQLRADEVDGGVSDGADARSKLGDEYGKMEKAGFAVNRGETKTVFDLNTAYIKELEGADTIDPDKLTYKDAGLASYEALKGAEAINIDNKATPESLLAAFAKDKEEVNGEAINLYTDYAGRQLAITENDFTANLKGKYLKEKQQRDKLFNNVPDALKSPDEVYFTKTSDNTFQYRYMKFFKDAMFVVDTEIGANQSINIKSWYKGTTAETSLRKGLVIKNQ